MCGRFTLRATPEQLTEVFNLVRVPENRPRYNIAPTQSVAVVRADSERKRELVMLRWGLIPSWAKDAGLASTLINARSETAAAKPAFRGAMRHRRCLIPADGFYEWQAIPGSKTKQPLWITLRDAALFAFAGLWEHWNDPANGPVETCTILTTSANALLKPIHDRMPVILHPQDYDRWLDPQNKDAATLADLLASYPAERMSITAVSTLVNSPRNEKPECLEPLPRA
jgi:putative SOS response-associated peptidase YedK